MISDERVFLASRRGNWSLMTMNMIFPAWLVGPGTLVGKTIKCISRDTWMSSCLVYFKACSKLNNACPFCSKSEGYATGRRNLHMIMLYVSDTHVSMAIDRPWDKVDAWMFVLLSDITTNAVHAFASSMLNTPRNIVGLTSNFIGTGYNWKLQKKVNVGLEHAVDVGEADVVFCSEMICAFLQNNRYLMHIEPRMTTPQILLSSIMQCKPALSHQQYIIDSNMPNVFNTTADFYACSFTSIARPLKRTVRWNMML